MWNHKNQCESVVQTNTNKKLILTAIFIFTLAVVFGLEKTEKAHAAGFCTYTENSYDGGSAEKKVPIADEDTCLAICPDGQDTFLSCLYHKNEDDANAKLQENPDLSGSTNGAQGEETCPGLDLGALWNSPFVSLLNCVLIIILRFFGIILTAITTLFVNVVDVNVFNQVLGQNKIIYETWAMVRDTLNIAFILVLLFSAFCTVFQIENFGYKKLLLKLIIMALLVNFSFPIARVIIDFSNVIMYYLIGALNISTSSTGLFTTFARNSALGTIIYNANVGSDSSFLLAAVVFVFIFDVTLLVVTLLLLIRIVVLAILVIFSSIAFVGSLVPFLSEHASKWWTNLFKYSFFGPIMIFMIYTAAKMMASITALGGKFVNVAGNQTAQAPSTIAAMAFFTIPIVILWVGMSFAKTMSIAGAGAITGMAEKFIKGAGKQFSGFNAVNARVQSFRKERQRRREDMLKNNLGQRLGRGLNRAQDTAYSAAGSAVGSLANIPGIANTRLGRRLGRAGTAARRRMENIHDADVREHMKTIDQVSNEDELANLYTQARNEAEREAVLRRTASIGGLGTILNREHHTNDRVGLIQFMTTNFGDNDRSARLTSTLAGLEAGRHNTQYGGAAIYNAATHNYMHSPAAAVAPGDVPAGVQFAMAGGEHAQNVARNLRPGFIVTQGTGGTVTGFNPDFENFLINLGNDFDNARTGLSTHQIDQIPNSVIRQIGAALAAGAVPTGRTAILINALRTAGRI
jgi:hypothetical protein